MVKTRPPCTAMTLNLCGANFNTLTTMKAISINNNTVNITNNTAINPVNVAYHCEESSDFVEYDIAKFTKLAKELLSERINHCEGCLARALTTKQCKVRGNSIVTWEGGHFSLPTYNAMVWDFHKDWQDYSFGTWVQIMKQYAFSLASDEIRANNDFADFVMECIVSARG